MSRSGPMAEPYSSTFSGCATAILIGSRSAVASEIAALSIMADPSISINALSHPIREDLPPASNRDLILYLNSSKRPKA